MALDVLYIGVLAAGTGTLSGNPVVTITPVGAVSAFTTGQWVMINGLQYVEPDPSGDGTYDYEPVMYPNGNGYYQVTVAGSVLQLQASVPIPGIMYFVGNILPMQYESALDYPVTITTQPSQQTRIDGTITIMNSALIAAGAEGQIVTLSDNTKECRLCNAMYDLARRELLRAHPWNFATRRTQLTFVPDLNNLAPVPSDPLVQNPGGFVPKVDVFQWECMYPLPPDCLRVLNLDDKDFMYRLEGRVIMTNEATLNLRYIADVTDPNYFDSMFVMCLSTLLASKICFSLTQSVDRETSLQKTAMAMIPKARHVDSTENYPEHLIADELVNVRIGPNRGWVRDPQT